MKLPKMNKFHVFLMLLFFLVFSLLAKNVWDYYMNSWGLKEGFSTGATTSKTEVPQYNNDGKKVYTIMDGGTPSSGSDEPKNLYFDPDNANVFYVDSTNNQVKIHSREYGSLNTITVSGIKQSENVRGHHSEHHNHGLVWLRGLLPDSYPDLSNL